jgi:hypothetical protein
MTLFHHIQRATTESAFAKITTNDESVTGHGSSPLANISENIINCKHTIINIQTYTSTNGSWCQIASIIVATINTNIHIEVSISYSTAYAATSNDVAVAKKRNGETMTMAIVGAEPIM